MTSKLFRQESIDSKKNRWVGDIILSRPYSFTYLVFLACIIGLIIILFSIFGTYTKRSTVQGQLVPLSGLMHVYPTQPGVVIQKRVYEGKNVKKGDVLFTVSTTNYGIQGDMSAALLDQTKLKEQSIRSEISRMHLLHEDERKNTLNQIMVSEKNLYRVKNLIENQKSLIELARNNQQRYENAFAQNATSLEDLEDKKINLVNQITQYESLEREKTLLEKDLNEQKTTLNSQVNKQRNEIEALERLLSNNTQELIEIQSKQEFNVHSHISGTVGMVNAEVGQFIDLSKPVLTILPENTPLIAQLYVPSRAIGFVKKNDNVLLRYQAFPYQKFGHAKGQVLSIASTAMASQDLKTIGNLSNEQINNEPVYLVRVMLNEQIIKAYGNNMPLQVGMTLEADIMHETRRLYEWVLEPLFSITGKL